MNGSVEYASLHILCDIMSSALENDMSSYGAVITIPTTNEPQVDSKLASKAPLGCNWTRLMIIVMIVVVVTVLTMYLKLGIINENGWMD